MDIADAAASELRRTYFHLTWYQFNAGRHLAINERKTPIAHRFRRYIDHIWKQMLKAQMTRVVFPKALNDMIQHDVVIRR